MSMAPTTDPRGRTGCRAAPHAADTHDLIRVHGATGEQPQKTSASRFRSAG